MTEEPVVPAEAEETKMAPSKPKAKAPAKRESKPEPEIPSEVSVDRLI